ncbi:PREDICTED: sperm-associated antigen 4 protein isoform X2 [Chinchilla lanigera]|uniref:sperm-associated antigen 4 protein isoform X2 n=1 Tax=Chinchilla lanigera TaxID=34839 RepID=UPI00038EEFC4|nr:PREDICTED: sperm-associated antigen 4 protein isoform X2 [Chinchilla lanigera]
MGWKLSAGACASEPQPGDRERRGNLSEEQRSLLATLDLRREMPALRATKSFLSLLFQVPRVLLSLVRGVLLGVCREVCCVRFLFAASLLSIFLAALSWGLLHLLPPLENDSKAMLTPSEYHERVRSHGQQLQQLQAELNKLRTEVARVRAAHSERVAKLVFQRLNEDFVQKPDYALSSVGATIDLQKTSHDYEDTKTAYFWNRFSFWNYARPPTVILEPDVFPGNCWAFQGDQGQVAIQLAGRVQLSDITLQHPPPSVAHTGDASSAPRDFAVFGLQIDNETEVFLGRFTFDVKKSAIQTFHLQNDPPSAFPKVKIQILSNWGHPRFTCLYRVRAHGLRISEGEDSATGATGGPH